MKMPKERIGLLGLVIALFAASGCDKASIVVDRAAGVSGTITNGTPYAYARELLTDAGAKEYDFTTLKRPRPEVDHSFRLANGQQLWLSIDKTNDQVRAMWHWQYRDLSPLVRKLTAYRIENSESKNAPRSGIDSTNSGDAAHGTPRKQEGKRE
jgi:hypothetical protein